MCWRPLEYRVYTNIFAHKYRSCIIVRDIDCGETNPGIGDVLLKKKIIFLMIASIKMIFVDDPKAKKLLSEAVYVTTDTVDPANDGKAVIESAPFKLVEPAYEDEMGLTLDSIRISRKKERTEYERKQNDEDGWKEKLVWNQEGASEEYIGEGMVGGYTLSEDFIHMIRMTSTWKDYDEQVLKDLNEAINKFVK